MTNVCTGEASFLDVNQLGKTQKTKHLERMLMQVCIDHCEDFLVLFFKENRLTVMKSEVHGQLTA